VYPFTGTEVVRSSEEAAQEIAEFIDARVKEMEWRGFKIAASILRRRSRVASTFLRRTRGRGLGSGHHNLGPCGLGLTAAAVG